MVLGLAESMVTLNRVLLDQIVAIAKQAGQNILHIYQSTDVGERAKDDGSPLTLADMASHDCIVNELAKMSPGVPILSEESKQTIPYDARSQWSQYWLIDPLDGTKEFIKRNGEFTVNIALIENHRPVLGVVYAPVLDTMYFAMQGVGAFSQVSEQPAQQLPNQANLSESVRMVVSKSHCSDETNDYIEQVESRGKPVTAVSKGSSLKLCMIAEGSADIYPRLAPTMEWDTAAAQCVVEQSGKSVVDYHSGQPLRYNKVDLLNPWFVVQ